MPSVEDVRPKIWNTIIDLYDDGEYSAIWGIRDDSPKRSLGVRWNGGGTYQGYPNQGRNPVWYSEPKFLEASILYSLFEKVKKSTFDRKDEFSKNILIAMEES